MDGKACTTRSHSTSIAKGWEHESLTYRVAEALFTPGTVLMGVLQSACEVQIIQHMLK